MNDWYVTMRVLALQPYDGGSHKYVLEALTNESRHEWCVLRLPARKWKWRMRHAALTFAEQLRAEDKTSALKESHIIFCTDMLNAAEFRSTAPRWAAHLPLVQYFHENQFAYPPQNQQLKKENDAYGFIHFLSGCAADELWFNSTHNYTSFFQGVKTFLKKMPDYRPWQWCQRLQDKSSVVYPGIYVHNLSLTPRQEGPIRIAWAARWEKDKRPEMFFRALKQLKQSGYNFKLRVLGQQFDRQPEIFERAREWFSSDIEAWGFEPSYQRYLHWLASSDVIVSTAEHEFFGIAILEAVAHGAFPILPNRLSYPELFADCTNVFYDGTERGLTIKLKDIATKIATGEPEFYSQAQWLTNHIAANFHWDHRALEFDNRLEALTGKCNCSPPIPCV